MYERHEKAEQAAPNHRGTLRLTTDVGREAAELPYRFAKLEAIDQGRRWYRRQGHKPIARANHVGDRTGVFHTT